MTTPFLPYLPSPPPNPRYKYFPHPRTIDVYALHSKGQLCICYTYSSLISFTLELPTSRAASNLGVFHSHMQTSRRLEFRLIVKRGRLLGGAIWRWQFVEHQRESCSRLAMELLEIRATQAATQKPSQQRSTTAVSARVSRERVGAV